MIVITLITVLATVLLTMVFRALADAIVVRDRLPLLSGPLSPTTPPTTGPMTVISRSAGGTVGDNEVTLVAETGQEYVRLPPGTSPTLEALLNALAAGTVMIIVGADGPAHVLLPRGSQVFTSAQTIEMLRSPGAESSDQ